MLYHLLFGNYIRGQLQTMYVLSSNCKWTISHNVLSDRQSGMLKLWLFTYLNQIEETLGIKISWRRQTLSHSSRLWSTIQSSTLFLSILMIKVRIWLIALVRMYYSAALKNCQKVLNNPSKNRQRLLKICQSYEIWSNLVTLKIATIIKRRRNERR